MAFKNLLLLDGNVGSSSNEKQQEQQSPGIDTQISGDAPFREAYLRFLDERPHGPSQPERFDTEDYEIALVLRRNRIGRTPSTLQPSTTMDHVVLSFSKRELLERVRSELSPSGSVQESEIARFGEVRVNFLTMAITRSEKPVVLKAQEFKLLRFLTLAPQRVFSRHELLNEVWGYNNYPSTRTVDNHIFMLRQKLEPTPARPIHFLTVHGLGYKFVPDPAAGCRTPEAPWGDRNDV
jgi:DNA-binding winged helix-turn-helix (wHTH) protein